MSVLLLLFSLSLQQLTWYEHYEEGVRAYDRGQYERALNSFDAAIAGKPKSALKAFTRGTQVIEYKPHYYRALILFKQERLDESYSAVQTAFSHEVLPNNRKLQADLGPIMSAYRERIESLYQQTTALQEQLSKRQRIIVALSKGDLDTAKLELANQSDMDDLAQLVASQEAVRSIASELKQQVKEAIDRLLASRNAAGANEVLNSNRAALTAAEQTKYQQAIETLNAQLSAEATAAAQDPIQQRQREAELERQTQQAQTQLESFRDTVANLEQQKADLALQVDEAKTRNAELQQQLSNESAQVPNPPSSVLTVRQNNDGSLNIIAKVLTPVALESLKLLHNEQVIRQETAPTSDDPAGFTLTQAIASPSFGNHQFRLEVTDQFGRNTSSEESYHLRQPLWAMPILWYSLIALLVLLIVLLLVRRQLRKRRAQLQHFNPYIAGSPVIKSDMFYGRDALLDRIHNAVHKNCFMIHGDRRIGKTSLLHQLKRKLDQNTSEQYRFYAAFIDLQGVSEHDLFHHIMAECLLEPSLKHLDMSALVFQEDQDQGYSARQFSRDLKTIVAQIQENDRHAVLVLLLDEVDVLNEFSEKTNQKLRGIFMKDYAEHLSCVMAGIGIKKEWESAGSPWYNFFEEIPMHDFDRDAARALILDPVKGIFSYTPDAIEAILRFCGGKPYLIQKMCVSLIDSKLRQGSFRIEASDVVAYKDSISHS